MSRAPRATCAACKGSRGVRERAAARGSCGRGGRAGGSRPGHALVESGDGAGDHLPLGGEAHQRLRVRERHPADLVELVVVERQVAAHRLHQVVVDRLVDARPLLDEPVLDGPHRARGCGPGARSPPPPRAARSARWSHRRPGVPLGNDQVTVSRSRRRRPSTSSGPDPPWRSTTPPAEVARAPGIRFRADSVTPAMGSLRRCADPGPRDAAGSSAWWQRWASAADRSLVRCPTDDGRHGSRREGRGPADDWPRHERRAPGCWACGTPAAGQTGGPGAGFPAARTGSVRWCRGRR